MTSLGANVVIAGCSRGTFTIHTVRIVESKAEITQILSDWQVAAPSTQLRSEQNHSSPPFAGSERDTSRQQRLEVAHDALSYIGICRSTLANLPTDIRVDASPVDTTRFSADLSVADVQTMIGSSLGVMANRVFHTPNIDGPNFAMRTACFWSLSALPRPPEAARWAPQ